MKNLKVITKNKGNYTQVTVIIEGIEKSKSMVKANLVTNIEELCYYLKYKHSIDVDNYKFNLLRK